MIFATFRTLLLLCILNNQCFPPARYFIPVPTGLKYLPFSSFLFFYKNYIAPVNSLKSKVVLSIL